MPKLRADAESQATQTDDERRLARESAVRLLSRREHSARELREKLTQKGFSGKIVGEVVEVLRSKGLQSDERFAESFVAAKRARGYGPMRIVAELKARDVDDEIIVRAIDESEQEWVEMARQVRAKRFGVRAPADFTQRAKQQQFLLYRGFSHDQIRDVFRATSTET